MADTVTDYHNNLLPRGEEKFIRASITSGTPYTASGVLLLTPSGSNVTYLLYDLHWIVASPIATFGNGISLDTSDDPNSEEWSQSWVDLKELAIYSEKGTICHFDEDGADCVTGRVMFQPMFRMDAAAGQSFLIEVDGTPNADIELLLRYCKVDTRNV